MKGHERDSTEFVYDRDEDDIPLSQSIEQSLAALIQQRLSRRSALKGMAAVAAAGAFGAPLFASGGRAAAAVSSLTFEEIRHDLETNARVASGYSSRVLIRWGDKVTGDAPKFDVNNQSAAAQQKQFGYNNDFIAYMPLPYGSDSSESGLLCVNHETSDPQLMWSVGQAEGSYDRLDRTQVAVEMAAHGHSVIEVRRDGRHWQVVENSTYNRRITPDTPILISGPAGSHDRLKTRADPTGKRVLGTINNCAGGTTPWGTVLIAEEHFHDYFRGNTGATSEARNYKRYGLESKERSTWAKFVERFQLGKEPNRFEGRWAWAKFVERFDIDKEPNEPNRFGWVVEFDPYDSNSTPVKRTTLGRFKHECATTVVNPDGRVVVYSGDDQRFEYLYKFVTQGRYDSNNHAANRNLLDTGTLYVAKFNVDATMTWMPLVFGTGPLTSANGFESQADVLIETRRAADLLGATPMDRPEDVETNPRTGRVYVMLSDNSKRSLNQINAANKRPQNRHGHIIELIPPGGHGRAAEHAALEFRWEFFLLGGDPENPDHAAMYLGDVSANGWVSKPDNCAFDGKGRIWITTDGQSMSGFADSVYAADTSGPGRGVTRCFFNAPTGAGICGPTFTPDDRTLFLAIQHPGDNRGSTFDNPSTRWPDFKEGMPPRPSVVAITKNDGGKIGD